MKITITLEVRGRSADVVEAVRRALDAGALQDAINEAGCYVESAIVEPRYHCASPNCLGFPYKASEHAHPADICTERSAR